MAQSAEEWWTTFLTPTGIDPEDITKYVKLFVKNAISADTLDFLDTEVLIEIGVKTLGHRLSILQRIKRTTETPPILSESDSAIGRQKNTAKVSAKLTNMYDLNQQVSPRTHKP